MAQSVTTDTRPVPLARPPFRRPRHLSAYALAAPAVVILAFVTLYPIVSGVYTSFTQWNWAYGQANAQRWIGLANYGTLLHDSLFWSSLGHTLLFTGLALVIEFSLGLTFALLLDMDLPGITIFRATVIFPLMVSDIVAAVMWKMLLDPSQGFVDYILGTVGLPTPDWLGDPHAAFPGLAIVDTWWQTGNIVLILLAGLQSLPTDVLEMAKIDGASAYTRFRYIVLPLLRPFILFALLFRAVDLFRVFALVWGITSGGPAEATNVSQLYIYTTGLGDYLNMGYASAMAVAITAIMGVFVAFYFLVQRYSAI
jgi:multiple sugar transport system permease protein